MSEHAKKHEIKILTIVSNKKLISVSYICTYTPSYIYVLTLPAIRLIIKGRCFLQYNSTNTAKFNKILYFPDFFYGTV